MSAAPPNDDEPATLATVRQRLSCPRCGSAVRRRRRTLMQRWMRRGQPFGRYRCADRACSWTGLLARELGTDTGLAPPPSRWRRLALRGAVPLVLSALAVAAAQWGSRFAPVANVAVGARVFAPGEAFDGEALPVDHPLLVPAVYAAQGPATEAGSATPTTTREAAGAAPLSVRRFCAWGRPGRMPYRGTVDEAFLAARLPDEVREQIVASVAAGRPNDRLTIDNTGIRAASRPQVFDPGSLAMSFGRTLCLGTRVNFKPGHTEAASLYEAFDSSGRRHSVMIPDVCGNVTVLRPLEGRPAAPKGVPVTHAAGLDPLDPGTPGFRVLAGVGSEKPNEVPAPGTLYLSLAALGAGWLARRAAIRRDAARRGTPVRDAGNSPPT